MTKKTNNSLPIDQLPSDDATSATENLDEIEKTRRDVMLAGLEALRHIDTILQTTTKPEEQAASNDNNADQAESTLRSGPAQHQIDRLLHPVDEPELPQTSLAEQILAAEKQTDKDSAKTSASSAEIVAEVSKTSENIVAEPSPRIPTDTINANPTKETPDPDLIAEIMTQIVTDDITHHRNRKKTDPQR